MTWTRNDLKTPQQLERLLRNTEKRLNEILLVKAQQIAVLQAQVTKLSAEMEDVSTQLTSRISALNGALATALQVSPADVTVYDEETNEWITGDSSLASLSTSLVPNLDNTYDIGSTTHEWKDLFVDGVAYIDELGQSLIPDGDNTRDIGAAGTEWKDLYIDGTANIDSLVADTADVNGGTIDGTAIGGASRAAGSFTTLYSEQAALQMATLADAAAPNNDLYYSSTQGKLVYKDSGGTVHDLY